MDAAVAAETEDLDTDPARLVAVANAITYFPAAASARR
jgi:hypothetical protein